MRSFKVRKGVVEPGDLVRACVRFNLHPISHEIDDTILVLPGDTLIYLGAKHYFDHHYQIFLFKGASLMAWSDKEFDWSDCLEKK